MGFNGQGYSAQDRLYQISTSNGFLWAPMVRATQLKTYSLKSSPPMASYGLQWSGQLSSRHAVSNLHIQWPPMGSNGQGHTAEDMQSQISTSHGLLWAPIVWETQLKTCSLNSPPPMASYGLQWSGLYSSRQAVSNLHLPWPPTGSNGQGPYTQDMLSQISTSYGLLWAPMARPTRLKACSLKSPPPMDS